ncbi:kinesin-like protein KIN-7C, mitochondrial isoform X2 [Durio zibethinus]|uniref:Kinesin-like protein KIN-7C, mitochondrial isoform X2 n=1 Tax=Durio zibethinus TaxID=66656 RepID=A0A6P6ATD4_DURZI|nr:kinesin-like protein KIN-7C, mitochondrial isoform X2 [Durio zibethinus]
MSSRSHRSSISPFRSRKSPVPSPSTKTTGRPVTPSSTASSRPPSRLSPSPATSSSPSPGPNADIVVFERPETSKPKENVTVTVRFRPLSPREINKGDEIAWYADGDYTVRNEFNPSIAYGFDRVFGPATTTRHVYDVAAQHVVSGAMEGINGTVFAYGVTSSGKTHTMHGEQKSPGIIPLAVKDVFATIQETPGREFLLRVSYLEIYNEVINDLLDPTGQNLRIREDAQGTYVEGIKEEVVLSPAHALSLIASGEEHRHVGSNNFNLLSSRSHTIFTLTIESSPRGEKNGEEDVTLSQLNLIDLAGSESSKTETTGLRRKEGSYINKSLLTLGTVISKLTDGKATHIPYRDSKLTRLLQSSLSGHGRISLICTVTPASSNSEETHNTLKFAHRSKRVEIKASQNKIMDEKSLIKKYQKEISSLKHELEQLRQGMMESPYMAATTQEDLVNLKLQLEAGQVKLQSRLEEEEQAKAALMGRIQRLTKLILVSTKNSMPSSIPERSGRRRRHSFGEDELAYLPDRKREYIIDDDAGSCASELSVEGRDDVTNLDELVKDYKRNRRRGMLGWFKLRKPENLAGLPPSADSGSSASGSPASCSKSLQDKVTFSDTKDRRRKSVSSRGDDPAIIDSFPERTQAGDLFSATVGGRLPPSGTTITDQMDLLQEQMKMLAGEVALSISSLKRLSEKAARSPEDSQLREQMRKLKDEINEKRHQIRVLEQRMIGSVEKTPDISNNAEMSQALSKLTTQLNEKTFELEIKSADNRILQEQLQLKISENVEMQETILLLRQQLNNKSSRNPQESEDNEATPEKACSEEFLENNDGKNGIGSCKETYGDVNTPTSVMSLSRVFSREDSKECDKCTTLNSQVLFQAAEIESLKQEKVKLTEEKDGLEIHSNKLAEEASYAKELAAAAAVELRNLAEEVTRLSYENAKLTGELAAAKEACCRSNCCQRTTHDFRQNSMSGAWPEVRHRKQEDGILIEELQKELDMRNQREAALEAALSEREQIEGDLQRRIHEAKRREEDLENELADLWMLVAKMRKSGVNAEDISSNIAQTVARNGPLPSNGRSFKLFNEEETFKNLHGMKTYEELRACYQEERRRCEELERLVSRMKGEDISGLDVTSLEELQNFHVEAITKICHAKCANYML